jgi:osmotically-inducible protein OsmY
MRRNDIPLWMVGITALALAACDRPMADPTAETRRDAETLARADRPAEQAAADLPDADDTGINTRDRAANAVTPMDQSNEERDLEVTREIREAITADDSLSTDAQNVKVVTEAGVVVLRGPVESDQEKAAIVAIAMRTAGVSRVDDQLEVARD